jgi:hypothetical protein
MTEIKIYVSRLQSFNGRHLSTGTPHDDSNVCKTSGTFPLPTSTMLHSYFSFILADRQIMDTANKHN